MFRKSKVPHWTRLDNAAKIFPPTSNKKDNKVFRFACELKETIQKEPLKKALNKTLTQFSYFTSTLKRGLFWYYLEESNLEPQVEEESLPICSPLYNRNQKTLLFRVSYYHKRINLEIFHALADGTGALEFLKMIVYYYLLDVHKESFTQEIPQLDYDASKMERLADSFQKYYQPPKQKEPKRPSAYQITGPHLAENRLQVVEGIISVKKIKALTHKYETTITIYLTALFIKAILDSMPLQQYKRPISLLIPVNLRQYFPSASSRNFFGIIQTTQPIKENLTIEEIILNVKKQFQQELTKEKLEIRMNTLASLEHNLLARGIPLFLKDISLKIASNLSAKDSTATLSNVGKINMPKELVPYINLFDVFTSTDRLQACLCSFEDNLVISFTTHFVNTEIIKNFFRMLTEQEIPVQINTNLIEEEKEAL